MSTETESPNKVIFDSVEEIATANKEAGYFFFSEDTMRFFDSKINPEVFGPRGRFFIISDKAGFEDDTREFKIKWANGNGSIENVELHTYEDERVESWASLAECREILRGNLRWVMEDTSRAQVLFDPYTTDAEANAEHFQWLVGIGHLKVGTRTTVAECQRMIEEGFIA